MREVRPIDANALLELYTPTDDFVDIHACKVPIPVVVQNILDQPTIDYAPVGRGQWEDGAFENSKRCTNCGRYSSKIFTYREAVFDYLFCPYCGIKLGTTRGERK